MRGLFIGWFSNSMASVWGCCGLRVKVVIRSRTSRSFYPVTKQLHGMNIGAHIEHLVGLRTAPFTSADDLLREIEAWEARFDDSVLGPNF